MGLVVHSQLSSDQNQTRNWENQTSIIRDRAIYEKTQRC
jgi:hypothetical protein